MTGTRVQEGDPDWQPANEIGTMGDVEAIQLAGISLSLKTNLAHPNFLLSLA